MIDVIPLDRVAPQPWRNGGGVTRELLTWPDAQAWQLRISVADIGADGAFSGFAGVERHFAVLSGAGVVLRWRARRELLTATGAAARFDGGDPPRCELLGGATRDLNLMARREAGHGSLQRAIAGDEWLDAAPLRAVFTTASARLQIDDTDAAVLPAWSLGWSGHAARQRWRLLADEGHAWWMAWRPHAP